MHLPKVAGKLPLWSSVPGAQGSPASLALLQHIDFYHCVVWALCGFKNEKIALSTSSLVYTLQEKTILQISGNDYAPGEATA